MGTKRLIATYLIGLALFIPHTSFAVQDKTELKLEEVVINKGNDQNILIPLINYKLSLRNMDDYYDYYLNDEGHIKLIGVSGGGRAVSLLDYKLTLRNGSSINDAIKNSPQLSQEILENLISYEELDYQLKEIKIGSISGNVVGDKIYFDFPKNNLNKPLNNFYIKFSNPTKVQLLEGHYLNQRISDKLISSGYDSDSHYSEYNINFGETWKYSHIVDALDRNNSAKISVVNKFGLVKKYDMIVNIGK